MVRMQYVKAVIIYLDKFSRTHHFEDTCLPISNNIQAAKKLEAAACNHFSNLNLGESKCIMLVKWNEGFCWFNSVDNGRPKHLSYLLSCTTK